MSEHAIIQPFDLGISRRAIEQWSQADTSISEVLNEIERFNTGMFVDACVVGKNNGGLVCTIAGEDIKGFTSTMEPKYALPYDVYSEIAFGDHMQCQIMEYDVAHKSFQLRYISRT